MEHPDCSPVLHLMLSCPKKGGQSNRSLLQFPWKRLPWRSATFAWGGLCLGCFTPRRWVIWDS